MPQDFPATIFSWPNVSANDLPDQDFPFDKISDFHYLRYRFPIKNQQISL